QGVSRSASSSKAGLVSNSKRRKAKAETRPIVSKTRRTQRRPIEARLQGHPLRVNAADLPRRRFLHLAASAATLPAVSRDAKAQSYPTRPITMIVPVSDIYPTCGSRSWEGAMYHLYAR